MPRSKYEGPQRLRSRADVEPVRDAQRRRTSLKSHDLDTVVHSDANTAHVELVDDFVLLEPAEHADAMNETPDAAKRVVWLPAVRSKSVSSLLELDTESEAARWHARCAVMEHLIDYYAHMAEDEVDEDKMISQETREDALALRAATKLRQLETLLRLHRLRLESARDPRAATLQLPRKSKTTYVTRPCMRCGPRGISGVDEEVMYPVDAGIAGFEGFETVPFPGRKWTPLADEKVRDNPEVAARLLEINNVQTEDLGAAAVWRDEATRYLRNALGDVRGRRANVYFASDAEFTTVHPDDERAGAAEKNRESNEFDIVGPGVDSNIPADVLSADALQASLEACARHCVVLKQALSRKRWVDEQRNSNADPLGPSDLEYQARSRRACIYNDALRESALSGDRLWAFAQQLSGTIGESVETVCVIDESGLQRQQQELQQRRTRAAGRASDAYMQIVRSVIQSTVQGSGLQLELGGKAAEDLYVSNAKVREAIGALMQRDSEGTGFFQSSVRLQELIEKAGHDMALDTLLQKLRSVGAAMQEAAMQQTQYSSDSVGGTSLEFLRLPRNALFVQWKDEAKAALQRAYDTFTREMQYTAPTVRQILVYELVEGVDAALCSYFAEFCGLMLASTRMHNPRNAIYVSDSAARTNGHKMRVSLHRLVNAAQNYAGSYAPPGNDRADYFRQLGRGYNAGPVMPPLGLTTLPYRGGWRTNLYGSS